MVRLSPSTEALKKRLERILHNKTRVDGPELSEVILPALMEVGRVALFGGAVRDIAREGADRFSSDLDFVVYEGDRDVFQKTIDRFAAEPNRFGGYRLRFSRWRVDVWMLEDTWAKTAGLREVNRIEDLLDCTFFDWDAVLYLLDSKQVIHRAEYFERLQLGVMDVNLEANPNPIGSLVRGLRRAASWDVYFGERLSHLARESLDRFSWEEMVALDSRAFARPILRGLDRELLFERLGQVQEVAGLRVTNPLGRAGMQMMLPFPNGLPLGPHPAN